jgi:hypothetical protein
VALKRSPQVNPRPGRRWFKNGGEEEVGEEGDEEGWEEGGEDEEKVVHRLDAKPSVQVTRVERGRL